MALSPTGVTAPVHHLAAPVHHATASRSPAVHTPQLSVTLGGGLPGSNPAGQPYINGPSLLDPYLALQRSIDNHRAQQAQLAAAHPTVTSAAAPAAPHPNAYVIPLGTFSGYANATRGSGLSGVAISSVGLAGQICPSTSCTTVTTDIYGHFTVPCAAGADYVQAAVGWFLTNISFNTCVQNVVTYIGTIYMVHDAVGIGIVKSDTPSHQNISGVLVTSTSRDGSVVATPDVTSDIYGRFYVPIPPMPSRIDFSADYGYFANFTYVNATPWENVSLGFVYLEHQVQVQTTLYDAVTRNPVPTDYTGGRSLTGCAALTNTCGLQGVMQVGATVSSFAPPGPDYVIAQATGYIQSIHSIGVVPKLNPGSVWKVAPIYLVPLGGTTITVEITKNHSTPNPRWGTGLYYVTGASMDAYSFVGLKMNSYFGYNTTSATSVTLGCGAIGSPLTIAGTPLRMQVTIQPDTTGVCGFVPMWPIPGLLPVWENHTAVNITPDEVTNTGFLNLTPGTYIEGNVTIDGLAPGTGHGPNSYAVAAQSQYDSGLAQYGYTYASNNPQGTSVWECNGGASTIPAPPTAGGDTFCVPAPPDASEIQVTALGYYQNFTWASTAPVCCNLSQEPYPLGSANAERFNTINVSAGGAVYGNVLRNNTTLGVQFGSYRVCTAGSNPFWGCSTGGVNLDGSFYTGAGAAPPGWDSVTVSAAGYDSDTVWGFVNGSKGNTSVGNITLQPLATVFGKIVNPLGEGLYAATVKACKISSAGSCSIIGAGLTTTDGRFNGTILGGWLPWTTYEIQASAAGYTTNWVWVNASSGISTQVPTIVVQPIAVNGTMASQGTWLDGVLLDNVTGYGVEASGIQVCPTDGSACTTVQDGANAGGYFNQSIQPGLYNLTVNTPGYYPLNVFFNASNRTFLHLGALYLTPLAWVSGNVSFNPWSNLSIRYGAGYRSLTLGPGAAVAACNSAGTFCGLAATVDSLGAYNASVPYGVLDMVRATGLYAGGGWSASQGFNQNRTIFNTTGSYTPLPSSATIQMDIYGAISGYVRDNSTYNSALGYDMMPVRWASVSVLTTGTYNGAVASNAGGGGAFTFFLPPGNRAGNTTVTALIPNVYYQVYERIFPPITPGGLIVAKNLSLWRYGWIDAWVRDSVTHNGTPYLGVGAQYNDVRNSTIYNTNGVTNADGFVNMTAPAGPTVLFSAGPGNDFNTSNFTLRVNSSSTAYLNSTSPLAIGNLSVEPWGWVRSPYTNYSVVPFLTTIRDAVNQLALPLATMTVTTSDTLQQGTCAATSNWGGQCVSDAPVGPKDLLTVKHWAYVGNNSILDVTPDLTIIKPVINLTGDGIVAGVVLGFPSGLPVPGASIIACPAKSTVCTTATANATGVFWINTAPGLNNFEIDAAGFVSNTSVIASPCSDCYDWIGTVTVAQFAYIGGIVRGLPSGLPIYEATVSVCSSLGNPTGPCGFFVGSSRSGSFLLGAPAGQYILEANDTFYNTTYFPISLVPGEMVTVGTIFLDQFGTLVGSTESATGFTPISNATILACPDWAGGGCVPPLLTQSNGHFQLMGAPGPYTISVSAPGYTDAYVPATVVSGVTTPLNPILLYPLGTGVAYPVTGTVVNASDPTQGIAGAVVSVSVGGTVAASTTTTVTGAFHLNVVWGTYLLTVSANGWAPVVQPLTVHAPVSELVIGLSTMTYTLAGTIKDGLTGQLLAGVQIAEGSGGFVADLGQTDGNGYYAIQLTNGTHFLNATYGGVNGVVYPNVAFVVQINGAPQTHNVNLYPPTTQVFGLVANSASGLPVSGVTVTIAGLTVNGVPETYTPVSDIDGHFNISVYAGKYTATVSASGFSTFAPRTFTASTPVYQVTVPLAPLSGGASTSTPSGTNGFLLIAGVAAVGVLGLLGAVLFVTRRRPPTAGASRAGTAAPARRT